MGAGKAHGDSVDDEDAQRVMDTGVRDQRLVISGWFASHADSGTRGPHVRLSSPDANGAVVRTDQVPELVDNLQAVRDQVDRQWAEQGEAFLAEQHDWVDANDVEVIRQRRVEHLEFLDRLREHFSEVADMLLRAEDIHAASTLIAPLLGVDEVEVEVRLNSISLFSLTRVPSTARAEMLRELRRQS
jgi:hypothetical protein